MLDISSQQKRSLRSWTVLATLLTAPFLIKLEAAPPRYDHIIIVVEENRTPTQIIGDHANAPYINSLAEGGVQFSSMFGLVHPSQPNYVHLFSGDSQGIDSDSLPSNFSTTDTGTYPFRTANLGASLIAAGFSFAGYSEQLETADTSDWADFDPHSDTHPGISYRRKHNPWANWVAKLSPMPVNQLPTSVNLAFTQFPNNDFANLPTLSFVIPNQDHDMHDGTRREADDWLRDNLGAYATWAKTNNSLLIVTWDEDDYNSVNQIPTVFYGAGLRDGTMVPGTWTLHNVLRTVEDIYGLTTHAGAAAQVRPIVGPFTNDPPVTIARFRQGAAGYTGVQDTEIGADAPTANNSASQDLTVDLDAGAATGNQVAQVLIRFNSLFGSGPGQIPTTAIILSAKLILSTPASPSGADYDSDDVFRAHRMIMDWNDSANWNSLNNGVSTDNIEAATTATFSLVPEVDGAPAIFDVTSDIEMFRTGTLNRGWLIRPSSSGSGNGWTLKSSEASADPTLRPTLEILYHVQVTPYSLWAMANGLFGASSAPGADGDRDGASNLTEFAYNLNPHLKDANPVAVDGTSGLPAARYSAEAESPLEVEFLRRRGETAEGLSYAAQFANDLAEAWVAGQVPTVIPIDADWERVRVRETSIGLAPQRFARVVVTIQQ